MFHALVITPEQEDAFRNATPEGLYCLDDVGDLVVARGPQPHIAPDLLDPWVFWQMVTGLNGRYTINGAASAGNWRLLPAAGRMADRLGLEAFAAEIAAACDDCAGEDPARLDKNDNIGGPGDPLTEDEDQRFFQMVDRRFGPFAAEDACLPPLADWVAQNLPRRIVADRRARKAELSRLWTDVYAAYPEIRRAHLSAQLGTTGLELLDAAGITSARNTGGKRDGLRPPAGFEPWETDDGQRLARIDFADAVLLADLDTWAEITRLPHPANDRGAAEAPLLTLASAPRLALDPDTMTLRKLGLLSGRAGALTYRS